MVLCVGEARAEEDVPAKPPAPKTRSYAGQTLLVDGIAFATMIGGVAISEPPKQLLLWPLYATLAGRVYVAEASRSDPFLVSDVGLALYSIGVPVVHAAHGRPLAALASFGMRAIVPSLGMGIGALIGLFGYIIVGECPIAHGSCKRETAGAVTFGTFLYAGTLAGIGAPVLVDALALAKEEAPAERPPPASIRVAPRMALTPTGGSIGLSGSF
jgi:hypothetical protein